jgi:acetoacetate decarboxylase
MATIRYGAAREPLAQQEPARTEAVRAWARSLWVDYETDPERIAQVLPRPLAAGAEPVVHVNVGAIEMSGRKFGAGNVTVRARHGDRPGEYALTMPMSLEAAVIGGRETYGEPKKLADIALERDGDAVRGTLARHGITYLELRGRVVERQPVPPPRETLDFYFKFLISPDGKGFDSDPALVYCRRTYWIRSLERVEGEVILRESPFDPVVDLPVRRIRSFAFVEHESQQVGEIVDRVPGEWIAPFAHQRYDTFSWRR